MMKKKIKVQCLVFKRSKFKTRHSVKKWISDRGFIVDNRLQKPIQVGDGNDWRVRQKNPDWFDKKTFKCESLGNGVKGVYGAMK